MVERDRADVGKNEEDERWNLLASCAGMTCHARRECFYSKIAIFTQFQVYLSITRAENNNKLITY